MPHGNFEESSIRKNSSSPRRRTHSKPRKAALSRRVPSDLGVSRARRRSIDDRPCFSRQLVAGILLGTEFHAFDRLLNPVFYPLPNPISL